MANAMRAFVLWHSPGRDQEVAPTRTLRQNGIITKNNCIEISLSSKNYQFTMDGDSKNYHPVFITIADTTLFQ